MSKYSYDKLLQYTSLIRSQNFRIVGSKQEHLDRCFDEFFEYQYSVENQKQSTNKNIEIILAAKFFNHIYSSLILLESGLIVDCILCLRNALEVMAFHWLIEAEQLNIDKYHTNKLKPVEVRKKLEELGKAKQVSFLKDFYSYYSDITHLGRKHERFSVEWGSETVVFGGKFSRSDSEHLYDYIPILFVMYARPDFFA